MPRPRSAPQQLLLLWYSEVKAPPRGPGMPSLEGTRLKAVEAELSRGRSHQVIVAPAPVAAFFLQHALELASLPWYQCLLSLGGWRVMRKLATATRAVKAP